MAKSASAWAKKLNLVSWNDYLYLKERRKNKKMADKTQDHRRQFTYVQWVEFFNPPSPPSKNQGSIKDMTRKIAQRKPMNRKIKRGPHSRTIEVLQNLREIRRDAIKNGFPIPKREIAMKDAGGISPYTWKENDHELWLHWDESRYRM